MKHLATIQIEFLKEARDWDKLSLEEQKSYLKRHPKSKRKITARPKSKSESGLKNLLEEKKQEISKVPNWLQSNDLAMSTIARPGKGNKNQEDLHEYNLRGIFIPAEVKKLIGDKPYLPLSFNKGLQHEQSLAYVYGRKDGEPEARLTKPGQVEQARKLHEELDKADFKPFPISSKSQHPWEGSTLSVQKGVLKDGTEVIKVKHDNKYTEHPDFEYFALNPVMAEIKSKKQKVEPIEVKRDVDKDKFNKINDYLSKNKLSSNSKNSGKIDYENLGDINFSSGSSSFEFGNPSSTKSLAKALRRAADFVERQAKKGEDVELDEHNDIYFEVWDPTVRDKYDDESDGGDGDAISEFALDIGEMNPEKFRQSAEFLEKNPNLFLSGNVD